MKNFDINNQIVYICYRIIINSRVSQLQNFSSSYQSLLAVLWFAIFVDIDFALAQGSSGFA
jgi:hypothetical protein